MEKLEIDEEGNIIFETNSEHSVSVSKRQEEINYDLSDSDEESEKGSAKVQTPKTN